MLLEKLLFLLTGVVVMLCIAVALLFVAANPQKTNEPTVAIAPPVSEAPSPSPEPPQPSPEASLATPAASPSPTPLQALDALIAGAPEYANFYKRLREEFPAEHAASIDAFAERRKAAHEAGRDDTESVDQYVAETVRLVRRARGLLAAHADTGPLSKIFDVQLKAMRAIAARDARLCVSFLYGGTDQDFVRFAVTKRSLVAEMAVAILDAIDSGSAKKIDRAPPTEADFKTLETSLKAKGLNQQAIEALLDGKTPEPPLDDTRMCSAGQTYLEALRALPEAARLRIYGLAVELLARS